MPDATGLELVTQVNPTGNRVYQTLVSDPQGAFVLHPVQTAAGTEPGAPGQVTILDRAPSGGNGSLPFVATKSCSVHGLEPANNARLQVGEVTVRARQVFQEVGDG